MLTLVSQGLYGTVEHAYLVYMLIERLTY